MGPKVQVKMHPQERAPPADCCLPQGGNPIPPAFEGKNRAARKGRGPDEFPGTSPENKAKPSDFGPTLETGQIEPPKKAGPATAAA